MHRSSCGEGGLNVVGVRVRLGDVLTLDVKALEGPLDRAVEHVRDAQARLGVEGASPELLELMADGVVGHVAVAGQLVGERAHVARALHVVLAPQRVDAYAITADVARRHCQVRHAHDHRRALAVLGNAEAVVDRGVAAGGVQAGGRPHSSAAERR